MLQEGAVSAVVSMLRPTQPPRLKIQIAAAEVLSAFALDMAGRQV